MMLEKINLRECGTCNLCCKLPAINEKDLVKPDYKWCNNCDIGVGCKIYKTRPAPCKDFLCLWKAHLTDLKPDKVGFFMIVENESAKAHKVITIYCETHLLDKLPQLIMKDARSRVWIDEGWAFHIRYNSDDNNIAIFDPKLYGMELNKQTRVLEEKK